MSRGKIEAKKTGKNVSTGQVIKTVGKTAGLLLAAGIALIAATDKTMSKAFPQEEENAADQDENE